MAEDLRKLANDLRTLKRVVVETNNRVIAQTARATQSEARRLSSGTATKYRIEVALDHAFAKRHGRPRLPVSIINRHTGLFWNAWQIESQTATDGTVSLTVRNAAPYAPYLESGTRTAFARPLCERLTKFSEQTWDRLAPPAFEAALQRTAFAR